MNSLQLKSTTNLFRLYGMGRKFDTPNSNLSTVSLHLLSRTIILLKYRGDNSSDRADIPEGLLLPLCDRVHHAHKSVC